MQWLQLIQWEVLCCNRRRPRLWDRRLHGRERSHQSRIFHLPRTQSSGAAHFVAHPAAVQAWYLRQAPRLKGTPHKPWHQQPRKYWQSSEEARRWQIQLLHGDDNQVQPPAGLMSLQ
eukprot:scaffold205715_cov39-Prasinocladus_malaysianus.AAC.1